MARTVGSVTKNKPKERVAFCAACGERVLTTSWNRMYCDACAKVVDNKRHRESYRRRVERRPEDLPPASGQAALQAALPDDLQIESEAPVEREPIFPDWHTHPIAIYNPGW